MFYKLIDLAFATADVLQNFLDLSVCNGPAFKLQDVNDVRTRLPLQWLSHLKLLGVIHIAQMLAETGPEIALAEDARIKAEEEE
jgi:hypothetical protein